MSVAEQVELALRRRPEQVDPDVVFRQPSMTQALVLGAALSGLPDKSLCAEAGLDVSLWSRVKVGQAHFPHERLLSWFGACGNQVPLLWLAHQAGYAMTPLESRLEAENRTLREQLERERAEMAAVKKFMRETRAA